MPRTIGISSHGYTEVKLAQVAAALSEIKEVASSYATINVGSTAASSSGQVYAQLVDIDQRQLSAMQIADPVRRRLSSIAGVSVRVSPTGPGANWPVNIAIRGDDLETLVALSNDVADRLARIDGVVGIDASLSGNRPNLDVAVDPDKASDMGVSSHKIGSMLRTLVTGDTAATWQAPGGNDSYDIKVGMESGALIDAGPTRLRPILMTTLATIFGMMALAFGLGATGAQHAPMAHAVIGGLISSTILTLVVVPVILTYLDALGQRIAHYLPKSPTAGELHVLTFPSARSEDLQTSAGRIR